MRTDDEALLSGKGPGPLDRMLAMVLRNKALVLIGVVLWVVLGTRAAKELPIDAVPDVTNVQVQILTDSPGLSPLEVERFVTWPVETAMSGLPETEEVRSLSRFGLSVVTVVFEDGTDLWWARQLVSERLGDARLRFNAGNVLGCEFAHVIAIRSALEGLDLEAVGRAADFAFVTDNNPKK